MSNTTFHHLPERCFAILPDTGEVVVLVRGEPGYTRSDIRFITQADARQYVDEANQMYSITRAMEDAMLNGALHGWNHSESND